MTSLHYDKTYRILKRLIASYIHRFIFFRGSDRELCIWWEMQFLYSYALIGHLSQPLTILRSTICTLDEDSNVICYQLLKIMNLSYPAPCTLKNLFLHTIYLFFISLFYVTLYGIPLPCYLFGRPMISKQQQKTEELLLLYLIFCLSNFTPF